MCFAYLFVYGDYGEPAALTAIYAYYLHFNLFRKARNYLLP